MPEKMLEVKVAELIEGDILAANVYNYNGGILVKKETEITSHIIEGLRKNFNGSLYIYRNVKESDKAINVDINSIVIRESEEIINFCILKFLKKNKSIDEVKNIILEILKNNNVMNLLVSLRSIGDNYFKHSLSVAVYSVAVGRELHFPSHRLIVLGTAALLHDIGMLKIDKKILKKTEILTEDEKKIIKKHPKYGFDIINEKSNFIAEIANIVLQHHERYDGTGYPNKIKNEKIHIMSKIIGICDVYEALTTDRPYRKKLGRSETIEYLLGTGDYYFNNDIIQALINAIIIYPYGQWVELNTGEIGVVAEEEELNFSIRPKIMVYFDKNNKRLDKSKLIDLSRRENNNILIEKII